MMGCRYNAKNTLDKNYLYLAEKHGARVFAETKVVDVTPLNGKADGSEGYEVRTVKSTAWFGSEPRRFTCRRRGLRGVRARQHGPAVPAEGEGVAARRSAISSGNRVRTNAESLIGVRVPQSREDLSKGIAIGSGVYLDEYTHIEAMRYPDGSDAMGFLATLLTGGRPGRTRILLWLKTLVVSPCSAIPSGPSAACIRSAGRANRSSCSACRRWTATSTCAWGGPGSGLSARC